MALALAAPTNNHPARYNSFDSRSSTDSNPSPSDLNRTQLHHLPTSSAQTSRALVKPKFQSNQRNDQDFRAMVKKFMERKSGSSSAKTRQVLGAKNGIGGLVIPVDFIAEDLKKTARKGIGSNFTGLHKKLFGKGKDFGNRSKRDESEGKALVEVKSNTRTLAMVLRSERGLLSLNKEQEVEISELKAMLERKNIEVEKLKDMCLKQREEIKSLKNAILFPDVANSQLHELLEQQGSELQKAKQLIPSLQRQVTSLTGQLQRLAEDLAEVKADKYPVGACYDGHSSSLRIPAYDQVEADNSLEFSSEDQTAPGSPDDMFLKDLNPCLTPYYAKTKSKGAELLGYESPVDERLFQNNRANVP